MTFRKGITKLLVRGIDGAGWVFCPMIKSIKNDKVSLQCCNKCTQFIRFEHNSFHQIAATGRPRFIPNHVGRSHFSRPTSKRKCFPISTVPRQYPSSISFRGEKQPIVDVFEEEDSVIILAELPGIEEKDIDLQIEENFVTIIAENATKKYLEKRKLPTRITGDPVKFIYRNNILQAKLKKSVKNSPNA